MVSNDNEWLVEHCDGCPAFFEMTLIGFTSEFMGIPSYTEAYTYFEDDQFDYFSRTSEHPKIGKIVIDSYLNDNENFMQSYKDWLVSFERLRKEYFRYLDEIETRDDYFRLDQEVWKLFKETAMPGYIDGFMFYSDVYFHDKVMEYCKKEGKDFDKVFSYLIHTDDDSFISERERSVRKILQEEDTLNPNSKKVREHLRKYSHTYSGYFGHRVYDFCTLENEALHLHPAPSKKKDLGFELPKELTDFSKLLSLITKWKDLRKEYSLYFATLRHKTLQKISLKTGIPFEDLKYSLSSDLKKIYHGEKVDLASRKVCLMRYSEGKLVNLWTGEEAKKICLSLRPKHSDEIKGIPACVGKIIGKAKVVMSYRDMDKVEKGDVLIAPMTRPEYLPAMKRSCAIVTNDGGITSHAAIVARELGKPCIVGTMNVTEILKDGDLIEVDANSGRVKILKGCCDIPIDDKGDIALG